MFRWLIWNIVQIQINHYWFRDHDQTMDSMLYSAGVGLVVLCSDIVSSEFIYIYLWFTYTQYFVSNRTFKWKCTYLFYICQCSPNGLQIAEMLQANCIMQLCTVAVQLHIGKGQVVNITQQADKTMVSNIIQSMTRAKKKQEAFECVLTTL